MSEEKENRRKALWLKYEQKWKDWIKSDSGTLIHENKHKELGEIRKSIRDLED